MGLVEVIDFVGEGSFLDGNCNDFKALYSDEIEFIKKTPNATQELRGSTLIDWEHICSLSLVFNYMVSA